MVRAGLTPSETLADATSVPAKAFSLKDRGKIATGLRADLLLVHGDPTRDIRTTRSIVAIWKQGVRVDRDSFRERVAQENEAWEFGAGWMPRASPASSVRIGTITGGPNHARATMIVTGEVNPVDKSAWAGAEYVPSLSYPMANGDISGLPQIYFSATKEWSQIVIPFSEFDTDDRNVALIQVASTSRGPFQVELADAHLGAHRWLGIELANRPQGTRVDSVNGNSPAQRAGIRAGDLITGFNGRLVGNYKGVLNLLTDTRIGDKVRLDIQRNRNRQTLRFRAILARSSARGCAGSSEGTMVRGGGRDFGVRIPRGVRSSPGTIRLR